MSPERSSGLPPLTSLPAEPLVIAPPEADTPLVSPSGPKPAARGLAAMVWIALALDVGGLLGAIVGVASVLVTVAAVAAGASILAAACLFALCA